MKRILLSLTLSIAALLSAVAATPGYNFESGKRYYISCDYATGYVAPGSYHGVDYEIYYVRDYYTVAADGYWYLEADGDAYTIRNAVTGRYLAWVDTYETNCKYLTFTDEAIDGYARWNFVQSGGNMVIQNAEETGYYFNLRTGTNLMGTYQSSYFSANGYFHVYDEDGNEVKYDDGTGGGTEPSDGGLWDASKTYLLHNTQEFGYIVYNPDVSETAPVVAGVTSKSRSVATELYYADVDETDPNAQWTVTRNSDGLYCFYNVGREQYLGNAAGYSTYSVFSDTPVYYEAVERGGGVYAFKRDENSYYYYTSVYLCAAPQQAAGSTIINYTEISDPGCQFELVEVTAARVLVSDITLGSTALKIPAGDTYKLPATISPDDATKTDLAWSSSNTGVATVTTDGTVTAVSEGTTTITARAKDGSGVQATCSVTVYDASGAPLLTGEKLFVTLRSGQIDVFPVSLVADTLRQPEGSFTVRTTAGEAFNYPEDDIVSLSNETPASLPRFVTYKFNNKYNDQLPADVVAIDEPIIGVGMVLPEVINLEVGSAIGKRLTASFTTSDPAATVYVDGVRQQSKVTRQRFDRDIIYMVCSPDHQVYAPAGGEISDISNPDAPVVLVPAESGAWHPFGREYTVHVDWLTDHPTGEYNVPAVYITLDGGASLTDIAHETYLNATIRVDGAGVYPNFPATAVQIKGRGNSSWGGQTSSTKNPYRLKFETKQKLFNLKKGKSWVLLANKQTGSMTTNAIAMKMADMVQAAGANHIVPVELYINGDYRGSYNFTEKVGFSNNSIDLLDESAAFMLELDTYQLYGETYDNNNAYSIATKIHEPDIDDIEDKELALATKQAILQHWSDFTYAVRGGDFDDWLDIDAFARYMFVTDFSRNGELKHPKSIFLYNENALAYDILDGFTLNYESPYVFGPLWDFDWAYGYDGTYQYFINSAESDLLTGSGTGIPFFRQLLRGSDEVQKAYYALWYHFINDGGLDELIEYCDDYYDYVNPSFVHNYSKWRDGDSYITQTNNAKTWLAKRAAYIFRNLTAYDLDDETPVATDDLLGDANGDGYITTADAVCALSHVLGFAPAHIDLALADVDGDGEVTQADVQAIVRLVMEQQNTQLRQLHLPVADGQFSATSFVGTVGEEAQMPLTLNVLEGDYSGVQFDVTLPEGMQLTGITLPDELMGYSHSLARLDERHWRVSVYSSTGNAMPQAALAFTLSVIADEAMDEAKRIASITNAMLVDNETDDNRLTGISVRFYLDDETTRVARLNADGTTAGGSAVYDLQGRRVAKPVSGGVYIVNGRKVIVK